MPYNTADYTYEVSEQAEIDYYAETFIGMGMQPSEAYEEAKKKVENERRKH